MSGSADKRRQRWLLARWSKNPKCDYCDIETRMCMPDELSGNAPDDMATTDHYVPCGKGGFDHASNWRLSCYGCNQKKGDEWPEVFLGIADGNWEPPKEPETSPLAVALLKIGLSAST